MELPRGGMRRDYDKASTDAATLAKQTGSPYHVVDTRLKMYRAVPSKTVWAEDARTAAMVAALKAADEYLDKSRETNLNYPEVRALLRAALDTAH